MRKQDTIFGQILPYDYLDYEELLTEEYKDLGYNPRNVKAVGKEIELD